MSYYIKVQYNTILFKALIDSGATICVITPFMVNKLGLVVSTGVGGYVQGIGRTKILGEVRNCNMVVNNTRIVVDFIVLNNQSKNLVILGQDFLEKYKCLLDCYNKKITINTKVVPIVPFNTVKNVTKPKKTIVKPAVKPILKKETGSFLKPKPKQLAKK